MTGLLAKTDDGREPVQKTADEEVEGEGEEVVETLETTKYCSNGHRKTALTRPINPNTQRRLGGSYTHGTQVIKYIRPNSFGQDRK